MKFDRSAGALAIYVAACLTLANAAPPSVQPPLLPGKWPGSTRFGQ